MSARNGDKARHNRLRKQKIARRVLHAELRKQLAVPAVPATAPAATPEPAQA
jgi:hypothetical protein